MHNNSLLLSKRLLIDGQIIKYILKINYTHRLKLDPIAKILDINFTDYLQDHIPHLTSQQIRELLKDGQQIGARSIDHPMYSELSEEEQIRQTSESMNTLEKEFGIKNRLFALYS